MFDGKAMKSARQTAHLTGKELAGRVGVTNVTISRIENQRQRPSRNLAKRIAEELAVDVGLLYQEDDDQDRGLIMPELSNEERDMLNAFRRLDPIGQGKAWAFVMGLANSGSAVGAKVAAELGQAAARAQQSSEVQADKQVRRA